VERRSRFFLRTSSHLFHLPGKVLSHSAPDSTRHEATRGALPHVSRVFAQTGKTIDLSCEID
jgi:hypothetical protein